MAARQGCDELEASGMDGPDFAQIERGFERILLAVRAFGSALGALDHGGPWQEIEAQAHETIRRAFRDVPALALLLPQLAAKLAAGASVADDGRLIVEEIRAARARSAEFLHPHCRCLEDARQPSPWTYERYTLLAQAAAEPPITRRETIRCRTCGRQYALEIDETPATHAIHVVAALKVSISPRSDRSAPPTPRCPRSGCAPW